MIPNISLYIFSLLSLIPWIFSSTRLADFMMLLDQNITEILSHPTKEQGEPLLYNLDEYIAHLRDVNHLLRFNPKFMYQTAKVLHENSAPQFLNAGLDLETLHNIFEWEDFKTDAISQYIAEVKNYTEVFKELFPKLSAFDYGKYDYESKE